MSTLYVTHRQMRKSIFMTCSQALHVRITSDALNIQSSYWHKWLTVCYNVTYYLIYLTLHWPIIMNNPLIFVSFTLLYSRGVPFVINKYCLHYLSSIPVKYRSGIGVWLRFVWFGFNPPLGNIFFKVEINEKCAKHDWVLKWYVCSIIIPLQYFYIWCKMNVHCSDFK